MWRREVEGPTGESTLLVVKTSVEGMGNHMKPCDPVGTDKGMQTC